MACKFVFDFAEVPRKTFFSRITKDIEIVRVVLLLTGSIEGAKDQVAHFVDGFARYIQNRCSVMYVVAMTAFFFFPSVPSDAWFVKTVSFCWGFLWWCARRC